MNRFRYSRSESGIALVITLIMLAIVTVMAIVFLALARRERASVKVVQDLATAQYMADAALERAKAQAIAQMAVAGSTLSYDLFVSTNFISPFGYVPQGSTAPNPTNVSYVYQGGGRVAGNDLLQVLRNLQYDARVPVFVTTNDNENLPKDFRYFLDFDRNRVFETNGVLAEIDHRGFAITDASGNVVSNRFVGDPEWVGVLEKPNEAHSESNRFVGRIAYLALPAGKTLSLNNIHNHANLNTSPGTDSRSPNGFIRHQGYGSWELNLAGFLRELNTNEYAWGSNSYFMPITGAAPSGDSFNNARAFLDFRYNGSRNNLHPASALFSDNADEFRRDGIDNYSDGPLLMNADLGFATDNDDPDLPWPGSPTTNGFYDVQEFFTFGSYSDVTRDFTNRLQQAMYIRPGKRSTYDQYTFYRLLGQMGVDSTPFLKGKLHLNYRNEVGQVSTNMVPWTDAVEFFTQAADLMLKTSIVENIIPLNHLGQPATRGQQVVSLYTNYVIGDTPVRPDISITNIQIWHAPRTNQAYASLFPNNEYSASVHRILQVAANVWDNMTNRWATDIASERGQRAKLPTVFKPIFTRTPTNVIISGFTEITNTTLLQNSKGTNTWLTIGDFATNSTLPFHLRLTNLMVHGQPWVIGAKKGHPNFNEISVESDLMLTRRLELTKQNVGGPVSDTNLLFTLRLRNTWGVEAWNSYLQDYNRNIEIFADLQSVVVLSNNFNGNTTQVAFAENYAMANIDTNTWPGTDPGLSQYKAGNFKVPIYTEQQMFMNAAWRPTFPFFQTNFAQGEQLFRALHDTPRLKLHTTNRLRYWVVDTSVDRVIDFVTLDNLTTSIDIERALSATNNPATEQFSAQVAMNESQLWDPRIVTPNSFLTVGITNQMAVSSGAPEVYANLWDNYTAEPESKNWEVDSFRVFLGLSPIFTWPKGDPPDVRDRAQTPFNPTRRLYTRFSWAADDPLVHYTATDLQQARPVQQWLSVIEPVPVNQQTGLPGNLGSLNERYAPWGFGAAAYDMSLKDPGIWGSDAWDFPIDRDPTVQYFRYPNIGWLGQVHRGSAWQTVYLKSAPPQTNNPVTWVMNRGTLGNHPVKDWRLLDVFTVAPNEAAASGLLSVNQTNSAAWAAVLSGLPQTIIANQDQISAENPPIYDLQLIEPASAGLRHIVDSINRYRATSTLKTNWVQVGNTWQAQVFTNGVFESLGHVLGAPGLSRQSPYLMQATNGVSNPWARITNHVNYAWTDRIVEQIPMQIMSLLQKDEPRFVVYAYGQALAPAPRSIVTSADYYGLCTNYQITGEVITKTTFRVEGELKNPANPLRAVVEDYRVLPPPE